MKKRNIIALSILLIVLLTLAFFQTPLMSRVRDRAWEGIIAASGQVFGLGRSERYQGLAKELAQMRAENIRLRAELQDYHRLKTQLGSPSFESLRAVPAAVVSRPIDTFHSQYKINKGIRQGITVGAPVVTQGSVLIGFVNEVGDTTATVETLLHPAVQITAETVVSDEEDPVARGLLRSRQYTSLHLTTVPRDMPLHVDQRVVTASKDEVPYGLVIGTISEVINPENAAYQEARISLPYDPDTIDAVSILVAP